MLKIVKISIFMMIYILLVYASWKVFISLTIYKFVFAFVVGWMMNQFTNEMIKNKFI